MKDLKKGIWLYFVLLIIEGGLRRWIFPGLAAPLLVIRDPLALCLLFVAYKNNYFPKNKLIPTMSIVALLIIVTALFFGHGNIWVALFGARILLIQFPMLFLIGHIFNHDDVVKMGKVILQMAIPMAILMTMQFYSPQTAFVNKGVGDSLEGAGFSGANGFFRPPGTFSFTSGLVSFFCLVACFVFYFWLNPKLISKSLLILATIALVVAIPTSISRSLFFEFCLSLVFFLIVKSFSPGFLKNMMQLLIGFIIVVFVAINISAIDTQIEAFTVRFTSANETEGGLEGVFLDRVLGGMLGAFESLDSEHFFFGQGIGMGTNVGAQLLSGETTFLISEAEWGRIIGESGVIFGLLIVAIRVGMTYNISLKCYKKLKNKGDALGWMLLSTGIMYILMGGWAQPNGLGFYVLTTGLILAALKNEIIANKN